MGCLSCLSGLAKYILFIFNLLIVVCAIVFLTIGGIALASKPKGVEGVTNVSLGGFAIAIGVLILIIAFLGCCGAIKEHGCMLTTYAVILIILFVLQVVLGALCFASIRNNNGEFDKVIREAITKVFKGTNGTQPNLKDVDDIQKGFKCCGIDGPKFWNGTLPNSCYEDDSRKVPYEVGCVEKVRELFSGLFKVIGGIAIGFAVVELLGAAVAFVVKYRKS